MDEEAFVPDSIMPAGTSLRRSGRGLRHIEQFLKETPEVESCSRRTGARLATVIAVFGGVAVSMPLSLVITPVLFCWLRARGL